MPLMHPAPDPNLRTLHAISPLPRILLLPIPFILPFLNARVGQDYVRPLRIVSGTIGLIVLPFTYLQLYVWVTNAFPPFNIGYRYLVYFAVASAVVRFALCIRRFIGRYRGEEVHSQSTGHSWLLHVARLHVFVAEGVIAPLAVGLAGWLIARSVSVALGWWLIATALSLCSLALWQARCRGDAMRATVDNFVSAQSYAGYVERHERRKRRTPDTAPDFADLG